MLFGQMAMTEVSILEHIAEPFGMAGYQFGSLLAVLFVSSICGLVGTMVVGNRMAFFSDAMAHCAFAGIALGILLSLFLSGPKRYDDYHWLVPLVMVGFGCCVGLGIALVRDRTQLASDTVIGVFFAGAIGFGAMLLTALEKRRVFKPEEFMFGSPLFVQPIDLLYLTILVILVGFFLITRYNDSVFASFHQSLAKSRGISTRLNNYLFILLLALIVNLSIVAVGVLLINAMLIVPAATATNVARNLRQLFWLTLGFSVSASLLGLYLSKHLVMRLSGQDLRFGPSGMIICISVSGFFLSMGLSTLRKSWYGRRSISRPT